MNIKSLLSFLLGISVFCILLGGIGGYVSMYQGVSIKYSSVESYDGTQIAILIAEPDEDNQRFGDQKYGVVVAHGINAKAESNLPLILELARAGFTVVALDQRGHGNSGGTIHKLRVGENEYLDVIRCAEFLKEDLDCKKVCLVGHSMGGIAATIASIHAEEKDVEIAGTIAISTPMSEYESEDPPESIRILQQFFLDTFFIEMSIVPYAEKLNETLAPYNYFVIMSESDEIVNTNDAIDLCDLAGGPGKTSKADFEIGNASDLYLIPKDEMAPDHGRTPKDPRSVEKIIKWIENSMGIEKNYKFDRDAYEINRYSPRAYFGIALAGLLIMLLPLYALINKKILSLNREERTYFARTLDHIISYYIKIEEEKIEGKKLFLLILISSGAFFVSPIISMALNFPVLQTYVVINVFIRDAILAPVIILITILLLKFESVEKIITKKNLRSFIISFTAASLMLFILLIGLNLFDTYYSIHQKWMPFTFNPFIAGRFWMFITLFFEILFIMTLTEYICRRMIQDRLFRGKYKFSVLTWVKSFLLCALIKAIFISFFITGVFIANDIIHFGNIIPVVLFFIITFSLTFLILEAFLTLVYQHSRDFWFLLIVVYSFAVWNIASWFLRI